MKSGRILKNALEGSAGLKMRSIGITEESNLFILLSTKHEDYYLVQQKMKLFAVPSWMIEKLVIQ